MVRTQAVDIFWLSTDVFNSWVEAGGVTGISWSTKCRDGHVCQNHKTHLRIIRTRKLDESDQISKELHKVINKWQRFCMLSIPKTDAALVWYGTVWYEGPRDKDMMATRPPMARLCLRAELKSFRRLLSLSKKSSRAAANCKMSSIFVVDFWKQPQSSMICSPADRVKEVVRWLTRSSTVNNAPTPSEANSFITYHLI